MLANDIIVAEHQHQEYNISVSKWYAPKPHGISGLFRLKNESETMVMAIESHLKWLDEAVLIVQESDDNTLRIARQLAGDNSKVKVYFYPFEVNGIGTPKHFSLPENSVYTMMHLTNWGISQCKYSWVAKVEGDVIALPGFERIRQRVDAEPDRQAYYGRVGLNVAGPNMTMFAANAPRNAGWDEAVFNNHPLWYCRRNDKWESMNLHDYRQLLIQEGWSFLHVKRCKKEHQRLMRQEDWQELTRENLRPALDEFEKRYPWPGGDKEEIYKHI